MCSDRPGPEIASKASEWEQRWCYRGDDGGFSPWETSSRRLLAKEAPTAIVTKMTRTFNI